MTQQIEIKKTQLKLKDIVRMANVAEKLSQTELDYYGELAVTGYRVDRNTRSEWEVRNAKALKLALQVIEQKSFPWVGASNVKFPLVTIAALQFLSRISILTKGRGLVKVEGWGTDSEGKKAQRADRISNHMSYQLLEEDRGWLDDDEQAKFSAALLGCAIKKSYHDGVEGINHSQYIPLMDFVVDYYCKDLDTAQRATHEATEAHAVERTETVTSIDAGTTVHATAVSDHTSKPSLGFSLTMLAWGAAGLVAAGALARWAWRRYGPQG